MKAVFVIFSLVMLFAVPGYAAHIKGGEVYYEYLGPGSGANDKYRITVRLFIDCNSTGAQIDPTASVGIFRNSDNSPVGGSPVTLPNTADQFIRLSAPSPCIVNPTPICYRVRLYAAVVELPKTAQGYTVIYQRCCRINGIQNLNPNNSVGASYTCVIHGSNSIGATEVNSNPEFFVKDTVLICQNRRFTLDFGASDPDQDSLSYQFCSAYNGGSTNNPVVANPPPPSSLSLLDYANGFSGDQPLGPNVTINPVTGIISGIAPTGGDYVVCVCLTEWRKGIAVSTHRKDFILRVDANCDFAAAELKPTYITCNGYDFSFQNEAPFSSLIHTYFWDFGVAGSTNDTSTEAKPKFVFPDTGQYTVKLIINKGESCTDSAFAVVKVYPGFFPDFTVNGSCKFNPLFFNDASSTRYGTVTKWSWTFGDETSAADSSHLRNASWKYSTIGYKKVTLTVESDKGCSGSITKDSVEVRDKPVVMLPFRDTLICSIDTLQLGASGGNSYSWAPGSFIVNAGNPNPLVFPKRTTYYTVTVSDNGCVNTDSIRVRVVDFVSLDAGADTTICLSDSLRLHPTGNGLRYVWSPAATLNDPTLKSPIARPTGSTTYFVTASIGKCNAQQDISVTTVPYPRADAGNDVTICYEDTVQLSATITGASFSWSPINTLINPTTLTPLAFPLRSTPYILTVRDNVGCPKPKLDTVLVTVRPKIVANAGRDTSIIVGQPLQLSGTGATLFQWSPPAGLSKTTGPDPVVVTSSNVSYLMKAYNEAGCFAYDTINIKVFKTRPDIFVPNAFTPGEGSNNRFRPIPVGISTLEFFRVYNRWGQMVFSSNDATGGWDGTFAGKAQDAGTYVWMVQGKDYTGKTVFKKGAMVLIR